jgi:hypothetical protein
LIYIYGKNMALFIDTLIKVLCIGGLMLFLLESGRRIGKKSMVRDPEGSHQGLGPVEAAVFGLMGLIIALTFSGAALRFDERRMLIIDEANAIGTAYLRVDLLSEDAQPDIRRDFREYLEARIELYHNISDKKKVVELEEKTASLQMRIWKASVSASQKSDNISASMLLLPALNSMIDICSTRIAVRLVHQPNIIFLVMILLALVCSLIAGYGLALKKSRSWIHLIGFILVLLVTIMVIIDIEYPRVGFIRIDALDILLSDLRKLIL